MRVCEAFLEQFTPSDYFCHCVCMIVGFSCQMHHSFPNVPLLKAFSRAKFISQNKHYIHNKRLLPQ